VTNILQIPQIQATFNIARNADWVDDIIFPVPGTPANPLNISGIAFFAQVRPAEEDPNILLDLSTLNGGLVNGGDTGQLSWHVSHAAMLAVPLIAVLNTAVMDILAVADGYRINLCQESGPAQIVIHHGVTLIP